MSGSRDRRRLSSWVRAAFAALLLTMFSVTASAAPPSRDYASAPAPAWVVARATESTSIRV